MRKFLSLLLTAVLILGLMVPTVLAAEPEDSLSGKIVILHSNDVHGAIAGYAKMATLKATYEAEGAEVILADAGDYSQGTVYVSLSKGATAVEMMNAAGYDVVTIGNHEFDYGAAQLKENMAAAEFQVLCANVLEGDTTMFQDNTILERNGVKIGFFGLETPEAQTKANPALIKGLTFLARQEMYDCAQAQVDALKADGADIIVCLAHLGVDGESVPNTSNDLWNNTTGIDIIIDGHSHTVMTEGEGGSAIQSTGTAFANVGRIIIDPTEKKIVSNDLVEITDDITADEPVAAKAQAIMDAVDAEYDKVFATSEVKLNGDKAPGNRTQETNLGDLITDSMIWAVKRDPDTITEVDADHIVAITNGGGIRAPIGIGDVTKKDVNTVLPFGNTVTVVYVTGSALLEALEASTYCTPAAVGGFPQLAGMKVTIDTTKEFDANADTYPGSTYYGPASIQRVTIDSVNGKPFDPEATYAVVTNNFCAAGGDTYYAFASATKQFDTGRPLDEVLMEYITTELEGVIGADYAEPHGNITVILPPEEQKIIIGGLDNDVWMTKYGNVYTNCTAKTFIQEMGMNWGDIVTVSFLGQTLDLPVVPTFSYVDSGKPAIIVGQDATGSPDGYVYLAINMGNFATTYGIAEKHTNEDKSWYWTACEGVEFPIEVTFTMKEKDGYRAEYILHELNRTNNREDYKDLTDEEFANFRNVATTGMGKDILYRTSSPINPELGRNTYADAAIRQAGVTVIMNLADSEEDAKKYEGFAESYYAGQKVIYLSLGVDFEAEDFQKGLAEGMRFFASNPGVYAVHCTEGKDRCGFVSALLECLMGATYEEVVADYMVTYHNYYGVEPGTEKYDAIAQSNIIKTLSKAFGVEDLSKADLAKGAEDYLKAIGLTEQEIQSLKTNLSGKTVDEPTQEPTQKPGDSTNPATGDFVLVYVGLAVASAFGSTLVLKKKEN